MANNTVKLSVYGNPQVEIEGYLAAGVAADTVLPGFLMEIADSGSDSIVWQEHSTLQGTAAKTFMVENFYFGKGIDDYYKPASDPSDNKAYMIYARPGDVIWAWLASGQSTVGSIGTYLVSDGAGMLTPAIAPSNTDVTIGVALNGVDASAVAKRIKVQII